MTRSRAIDMAADALALGGFAAVVSGLWSIYPPSACLVSGAALIAVSIRLAQCTPGPSAGGGPSIPTNDHR